MNSKRYWYNTPNDGKRSVGVEKWMGSDMWAAVWMDDKGKQRMLRTPNLPPCVDRDVCQRALDQFAAKRGLELDQTSNV